MSAYEERLLAELHTLLIEQDPLMGGPKGKITVQSVAIEPGQDEELVVILFRELKRPQCIFGYCLGVYEFPSQRAKFDDPAHSSDAQLTAAVWADMIAASLTEQIVASDMGLPATCDPTTVTWITALMPKLEV